MPSACLCDEPLSTHALAGSLPTLAGTFNSVFCEVTALLWVLVYAEFCLCLLRQESLFPPALWKSYSQIPLALKARFLGDSQSLGRILRLGSLTWGSEPSQQCENLFPIIVLQSAGHPPGGYRI